MFECLGCVRQTQIDCDNGSSEPESNSPSTTHTDDREYELENPHDLIQFLVDAKIRLVSLRYLMDLRDAGRFWPRRQEAEQNLVAMEEIDDLKQAEFIPCQGPADEVYGAWFGGAFRRTGKGPVRIYTVSHCWEAQQHPDPFGFQCRTLLEWFDTEQLGFFPDLTWLFIDFICLPQYKRTQEEQVCFCRAMKAMHLLYAHAAVYYVIRLEDMGMGFFPPEFIEIYCETTDQVERRPFSELVMNRVPYTQRGWCIAEVQWMSAKSGIHGYAPLTPAMFQERVKRGLEDKPDGLVLKFTHRDDLEAVVRLQEKVFLQHSQKRKRLLAHDLPLKELQVLAETLPSFENLEILSVVLEEEMVDVDFDACIATLRAAIPLCKGLRTATVVQRSRPFDESRFRKADLLQA